MYIINAADWEQFISRLSANAKKKLIVTLEGYHHLDKHQDILSCTLRAVPTSFFDNTSIQFHLYLDLNEDNLQTLLSFIKANIAPKADSYRVINKIYPLKQTRFL